MHYCEMHHYNVLPNKFQRIWNQVCVKIFALMHYCEMHHWIDTGLSRRLWELTLASVRGQHCTVQIMPLPVNFFIQIVLHRDIWIGLAPRSLLWGRRFEWQTFFDIGMRVTQTIPYLASCDTRFTKSLLAIGSRTAATANFGEGGQKYKKYLNRQHSGLFPSHFNANCITCQLDVGQWWRRQAGSCG